MPAKITPSQAKNFIRRALTAIVDPPPSVHALQALWDFFDSRCAYCDRELTPGKKEAHYDHLISKGGNALSNFALSCANCNEKEKLDTNWETFLRKKCNSHKLYRIRHSRIKEWQHLSGTQTIIVDPKLIYLAENATVEVLSLFERKIEELPNAKLG